MDVKENLVQLEKWDHSDQEETMVNVVHLD